MGRLINADALIEAITQHGKDIKSDVPMIEDIYQTAHKHIIDLVEIQPTAFDAEKVVAELEEAKKKFFEAYKEATDTFEILCYGNITNAYGNAIDIVKRGGIE